MEEFSDKSVIIPKHQVPQPKILNVVGSNARESRVHWLCVAAIEKLERLFIAIKQDDIKTVQTWLDENMPNHSKTANEVNLYHIGFCMHVMCL